MKKIIFFICFVLSLSCNNDDKLMVTNDLKKRVLLIEAYDPLITSYVSDSIIEYYENKLIVRKDHYIKLNKDTPFLSFFQTYEYNSNNYLIRKKSYNNFNLSELYASSSFLYNDNNGIVKVEYNKFNASNFSSTLVNNTTHFEYALNSVKKYVINHLNNDSEENLKTYVVYGNLDSINVANKWMYVFDEQNDLYEINCMGNDCDTYYNKQYKYESTKDPLISNIYGNELNSFLIGNPIRHYNLETAKKYLNEILDIYPTPDRNGELRKFNYTFDENDRLTQINTTGTFAANDIITYYYE